MVTDSDPGGSAVNSGTSDVETESMAVVNALRQAILIGTFHSGQRLVEVELSELFGASRGAVRQALILLENEGYVARQRNRGAWVRPVSTHEAIEAIEVRAVVDALCASKAAISATTADRKELRALGKQMQDVVKAGDVLGYSRVSQQIHQYIRGVADQKTAVDVIERLRYGSTRYYFSTAIVPGRMAQGLHEHLEVIKAIQSGDAAQAESAMRAHFASIIVAIKQLDPGAMGAAGPVDMLSAHA
jgi:DNA-binding GntR family transcriptional regulator